MVIVLVDFQDKALIVMTLSLSSGCNQGKDLRKDKGSVELVKRKDTGMYLCYLYEFIVQQWSIHED